MKTPYYVVHAFTRRRFGGNPAGVCPLDRWLDEATMQALAHENDLAETAFFVPRDGAFDLRWFTPENEMDLCGHATLASAWVLFERRGYVGHEITFHTKSGPLLVRRDGDRLAMDFPARPPEPIETPAALIAALGARPVETLRSRDLLCLFEREADVRALEPDMAALLALGVHAVIVSAPGNDSDFVSRFFAPSVGVPEDPVTGSAHCTLVPWWSKRLGKKKLFARQVSARGGELWCEDRGDRVEIAGHATLYLEGSIES
ncbi:MAG TPA: PhzF family phenazine biosynthesis protein [Candidatus Udaeobacter sp.]|nr:PhzF family phenazine biosynthesis protein [Candidatus Udaeobacter sp.]